jgi:MYXO-CTERM domain-containing protein
VTNQGIENHDGSAITIDKDILGAARSTTNPTAGPFEKAPTTKTGYVFKAGVGADTWGAVQASDGGLVLPDGAVKPPLGSDAAAPRTDSGRDAVAPGSGGSAGAGPTPGDPAADDEPVVDSPGGCGCTTSGAAPSWFGWLVLAASLGALRRKIRRAPLPGC